MRRRAFLALGVMATLAPAAARAHPMPNSTVWVERLPGSVRMCVSIPLSEMAAALGEVHGGAEAFQAQMLDYLAAHAAILGADGRPWAVELQGPASAHGRGGEHAVVIAVLSFAPTPGASPQPRTLRYDAVNHRVASHFVLVYLKSGDEMTPLARLQMPTTELALP